MMLRSDAELLGDLEHEFAGTQQRVRVHVVYGRSVHRESRSSAESGSEAFDPSSPAPGTTIVAGFDPDSARLKSTHPAIIRRFARTVVDRMPVAAPTAKFKIDVEGHEDETGDPGRFQFLGLERAKAVAKLLHAALQNLIDHAEPIDRRDTTLIIRSSGPTRPIRSNVTSGGRALNRRVELRIL